MKDLEHVKEVLALVLGARMNLSRATGILMECSNYGNLCLRETHYIEELEKIQKQLAEQDKALYSFFQDLLEKSRHAR